MPSKYGSISYSLTYDYGTMKHINTEVSFMNILYD